MLACVSVDVQDKQEFLYNLAHGSSCRYNAWRASFTLTRDHWYPHVTTLLLLFPCICFTTAAFALASSSPSCESLAAVHHCSRLVTLFSRLSISEDDAIFSLTPSDSFLSGVACWPGF